MSTIALVLALSLQAKDPDVEKITLDLRDRKLANVFEIITKTTGIPIELDEDVKKELETDEELISVKIEKLAVTGALKLLALPRGLDAKVVDKKKILIFRPKDK